MNYAKRTLGSWQLVTSFRELLIAIHEILSNPIIRRGGKNHPFDRINIIIKIFQYIIFIVMEKMEIINV